MSPPNTCPCPTPPGGHAVCEARQMAICRIKNGVVETACIDSPPLPGHTEDSNPSLIANFVLSAIYGVERQASQGITKAEVTLLRESVLTRGGVGETLDAKDHPVSFRLPPEIRQHILDLDEESDEHQYFAKS